MTLHDPSYFSNATLGVWERVIEALRRDWEQTKHDISMGAGHELNQNLSDTVLQVVGREPIPPSNHPNPRRFTARWVPEARD